MLTTIDPSLMAEDVALGYKQLLEVERACRALKPGLELRPLHRRLPDRTRAHVLLRWLALLVRLVGSARAACGGEASGSCLRAWSRLPIWGSLPAAGTV